MLQLVNAHYCLNRNEETVYLFPFILFIKMIKYKRGINYDKKTFFYKNTFLCDNYRFHPGIITGTAAPHGQTAVFRFR